MKLIDSKEAGRILQRTTACIRQICADEKLREELGAEKIGRSWVLDQAKVETYKKKLKGRKRRPKNDTVH